MYGPSRMKMFLVVFHVNSEHHKIVVLLFMITFFGFIMWGSLYVCVTTFPCNHMSIKDVYTVGMGLCKIYAVVIASFILNVCLNYI